MGRHSQRQDGQGFFDDFTDAKLARYYDFQPGIGEVSIRPGGLYYTITRSPDGPPSSSDHLSIDSLGRPQPPTAKAVLRFPGAHWEVSINVEYDFEAKSNGRAACIWIVLGEPSQRFDRSLAFVHSADLDPASHHLSVVLRSDPDEPIGKTLTNRPKKSNWYRVARAGFRVNAEWSEDGDNFFELMAWDEPAAPEIQSIVINSSSFAGGASFVVRSIGIDGSHPIEVESKPPVFAVAGTKSELAVVQAEEVVVALNAGRSIQLEGCAVVGAIDLAGVASSLVADLRAHACDFRGPFYASRPITASGAISITESQSVRGRRPLKCSL